MKKLVIRFRVISPSYYHTPMMYIPNEKTRVEPSQPDDGDGCDCHVSGFTVSHKPGCINYE